VISLKKNLDKPWSWFHLSQNPNIKWDFVKNHPDIHWNWFNLSENPIITWDIVKKNLDKPWSWYYLSCNPNITWDIVKNNPDKPWNWNALFRNSSFLCCEQEICNVFIKHRMTMRIQYVFLKHYYNPAFEMCRKRLLKEFNEMNDEIYIYCNCSLRDTFTPIT